jgi:SHS2 domain-containing protein
MDEMDKSTPFYTQMDHTADLRIRVHGKDPRDLFENAARALIDIMLADTSGMATVATEITLDGGDLADLMVRWLGEILYLFEGEGVVATLFDIHELEPQRLRATVGGIPFDPQRHEILTAIKAVTYHGIEVAPQGDRWEAKVTFDV